MSMKRGKLRIWPVLEVSCYGNCGDTPEPRNF